MKSWDRGQQSNPKIDEYSGMSKWQRDRLDQRSKEKAPKGKKVSKALQKKQDVWAKKYYTKGGGLNIAKWKKDGSPGFPKESVVEKVIKVSKKDDVPGNAMKMSGEEKIKKLTYSGSNGKGSYEIKGKNLNVIGIRPRDKGFFVRHFTMKTGFRKANLYYDGVNFMDKNKKF